MQKNPFILAFLVSITLNGCATFSKSDCQYDLGSFVPDIFPLASRDSYSISRIALTLPIFEIAPDQRAKFIATNGVVSENRQSLVIQGDGAQPTISIDFLDSIGRRKTELYRIRVVVGTPISEDMDVYQLHRRQGGWKVHLRHCGNYPGITRVS